MDASRFHFGGAGIEDCRGPKNLLSIRGIYSGGGAATTAIYLDDVIGIRAGRNFRHFDRLH
jgi:hypothetical protein